MGLEVGTFITDLNPSNPLDADAESFGAAHFRLVKSVLQNTLTNGDRTTNLALLNNLAALSVVANATNASAAAAGLVAGADGQVLRRSGTALAFGNLGMLGGGFDKAYILNDQTFTTTTLAAVTDMSAIATLEADTVYEIELLLHYKPSTTGGFKAQMFFSNAQQAGHAFFAIDSNAGGLSPLNTNPVASLMNTTGAGSNDGLMWVKAYVHTHATLTSVLSLQAALNSAAGNVLLKRGSFAKVCKFGVA